jgi:putative transport protein
MFDSIAFTKFIELLSGQPVLTLFLILGVGYLIGAMRIGSFSLGPVAGVLFAGLFLGHFGFSMSAGAQSIGFALFIFSVGYQAGPRFFDVLKTDGLKYFLLALVVAGTGFSVAVFFCATVISGARYVCRTFVGGVNQLTNIGCSARGAS